MRSSEIQPRNNIFKRTTRLLPIPVAVAAIVGIGCGPRVNNIQFPDCSLDPQIKTAIGQVGWNNFGVRSETSVDEITFKVSQINPSEIDLIQKPNRITVIEPNRSYFFQGQKDGRTYKITIDQDFKGSGVGGSKKNVNIVGACDSPPQTNP